MSNPIGPPTSLGLLDWLKKNFPTVHAQLVAAPKDTKSDYKDAEFAKKYPARSGKYGSGT